MTPKKVPPLKFRARVRTIRSWRKKYTREKILYQVY